MNRKTPELEFLFNKVAGLQHYQKETPAQVFSCKYCGIFINTYFETKRDSSTGAFLWILRNFQEHLH